MSDVSIQFSVDMKAGLAEVKKFSEQASSSLGGISKSVGILTTGLGGLVAGFSAAKLLAGFNTVIKGAMESERQVQSMVTALRTAGHYSDAGALAFRDWADQVERSTSVAGGLVLSNVALAKQFRTSNLEARELIEAAIELSAYTGDDLPASVEALGKTLEGTAGKLAKLVPELKDLTKEQLIAGGAIDLVAERFRGSAADATNTFEGAMKQATNAVSGLSDRLGEMVTKNDHVIKLVQSFTKVTQAIKEWEALDKWVLRLGKAAAGTTLNMLGLGFATEILGYNIEKAIESAESKRVLAFDDVPVAQQRIEDLSKELVRLQAQLDKKNFWFADRGSITLAMETARTEIASLQSQMANAGTAAAAAGRTAEDRYHAEMVEKKRAREARLFADRRRLAEDQAKREAELYDKEAQRQIQKFREMGASKEEITVNTFQSDFENLERLLSKRKIDEETFYEFKSRLERKFQEDLRKLEGERIGKIGSNPMQAAADGDFEFVSGAKGAGAAGLYGVNAMLSGAAGASKLVQDGAGALADTFLGPGMGQLVGPIVGMLAQGPDKVKEMVLEFGKALPEIIKNIALAIPALIEALPEVIAAFIEKIPEIAEALITMGPRIIGGLFKGIGNIMSDGFKQGLEDFARGLLDIPGKIITALSDGIRQIFDNINPFKGQDKAGAKGLGAVLGGTAGFVMGGPLGAVVGGALGSVVGGLLGFSDGGVVPPGHATDTYPSMLRSGERVLSPSQNFDFERMVDMAGRTMIGGGASDPEAGGDSRPILVKVMIGEKQLAEAFVDLKRQGMRLA